MRTRLSAHQQHALVQHAAAMRANPTSAEARLFQAIRGGRIGVAVRRQVPLAGRFIADLYIPSVKLVVEVDGGYHAGRGEADGRRDRALERLGFRVLRISNESVVHDTEAVVTTIRAAVMTLRGKTRPPGP